MDFTSKRPSKFEREQAERRTKLKKKKEAEDAAKRVYEAHKLENARLAEERRLEDAKKAEEREEARLLDERLTGGIELALSLQPVRVEGEDDKVRLPESVLKNLTDQDAFSKGAMMFCITTGARSGGAGVGFRETHCGVREFSADEGEIGLPDKVLASLGLFTDTDGGDAATGSMEAGAMTTAAALPMVHIKYVRLNKVTYVKMQPVLNRFFNLGPMKLILEENLRFHTTLSLGDLLTVWDRGESHELRVTDMKPESKGSLIDTDVEVDLDLSDEYLQSEEYRATQDQEATRAAAASSSKGKGYTLGSGSGSAEPPGSGSAPEHASSPVAAFTPRVISIPPPPPTDSPADQVLRCKIKTPARALSRLFYVDHAAEHLFAFVRGECAPMEGRLVLSTRFPPRDLLEDSEEVVGQSLRELGFQTQEMFYMSIQA